MHTAAFSHQPQVWTLLVCAWLLALTATFAALFIGEVMGQAPCVLCWFQRAFMFPLVLVLGVACLLSDAGGWRACSQTLGSGATPCRWRLWAG